MSCFFPRGKKPSKEDGCKLWSCENPNEAATLLRSIGLNKLASIALTCQLDGPALASVLDNLQPRIFSTRDDNMSAIVSLNGAGPERSAKTPPEPPCNNISSSETQASKQNCFSAEEQVISEICVHTQIETAEESVNLASVHSACDSSAPEAIRSSITSSQIPHSGDPGELSQNDAAVPWSTHSPHRKSKGTTASRREPEDGRLCGESSNATESIDVEVKQNGKETRRKEGAIRVKSRRQTLPLTKPHASHSEIDNLADSISSPYRRYQDNEKFLPIEEDDVDTSQPLSSNHDSLLKLLYENDTEKRKVPMKGSSTNGKMLQEKFNNGRYSTKKRASYPENTLNGDMHQSSSDARLLHSEVDLLPKQPLKQKNSKSSTGNKKLQKLNGESQCANTGAEEGRIITSSPNKGGNGLAKFLAMARLSESSSFHEASQNSSRQDDASTFPQAVNLSDLHPYYTQIDLIRKTEIASKVQVPKLWAEGSTPRTNSDTAMKINYSQFEGEQSDRSLTSQGYTSSEVCSVTS
eukprot:762413-Hanusia_phi.AAC.7